MFGNGHWCTLFNKFYGKNAQLEISIVLNYLFPTLYMKFVQKFMKNPFKMKHFGRMTTIHFCVPLSFRFWLIIFFPQSLESARMTTLYRHKFSHNTKILFPNIKIIFALKMFLMVMHLCSCKET